MGITLGQSTLGDVRAQHGEEMELAVIQAPGQKTGGLEMFYSRFRAGLFSGKLVVAADIDPGEVTAFTGRAVKSGYMQSGARKFSLAANDRARALQAPVASVTFIPTVKIDEAALTRRFGEAAERIRGEDEVTHLLYPDKGLDLIVDLKGRAVFQYVAPRDFQRLRQPLLRGASE